MIEAIRRLIRDCGLSRFETDLMSLLLPSIRMKTERAKDESIAVGESRIGGLPELPDGAAWPYWKGAPLAFLAQIRLADLVDSGEKTALPSTGQLLFFYDPHQSAGGFDPADAGSGKALYFNATRHLKRLTPPPTLPKGGRFESCRVQFGFQWTLPPADSLYTDRLGIRWERGGDPFSPGRSTPERDAYYDLLDRVDELYKASPPYHQIAGHPRPVQNEMQLECQLASHGIYCGDGTGFRDPRRAELEKGAMDWRLLLQIDTDDKPGMEWGDMGMVYFWIKQQQLEKYQFDEVWTIFQCG